MIGQEDLETLWRHVGDVADEDNFEEALRKVEAGITGQTNQAISRHKLFTKMEQGEKDFAAWYPIIKEQALRCKFNDYNADAAARDAILYQTSNEKLQREILAKDLDFKATVKAGLALEQSKTKQENMTDRKRVEDGVPSVVNKSKEEKVQVLQSAPTVPFFFFAFIDNARDTILDSLAISHIFLFSFTLFQS
jgi:hypothetical protein